MTAFSSLPVNEDTELRLLQPPDAARLFQAVEENREHLRAWLPWVDDTRTVADSERFIGFGLQQMADGNGFHTGIWHKGELVGVLGYNYIRQEEGRTEFGYWLTQAAEGKGLMTQSVKAMLDYAFDVLSLKFVEIRCAVGNARSQNVPKRLGFRYMGRAIQMEWLYHRYVDIDTYGLSVDDWRAQQGEIALIRK